MNLVKIEFNKIQKSRIGKILIPVSVLAIIVYSIILMSTQSQIKSNFEYMVGVLNNINMFGIIMFITVYCTALLFANEFENRIVIYVNIRHIPIRKIYISRILAIILYVLIIYLLEFIILSIIGTAKYGITPLTNDLGIVQSFIKVLLLMIEMWMSNLFIISIGILVSVIVKNQILTIVISVVSTLVLNIIKNLFPKILNKFLVTTYLDFYQNNLFTVNSMGVFIVNIILALLVFGAYSFVLYMISESLINKENREE